MWLNSLPNDNILDWSKFKAFAGNKINVTKQNYKLKFVLEMVENIVGKGEICWLPAFSPFHAVFKGSFHRVIKSLDCAVKS